MKKIKFPALLIIVLFMTSPHVYSESIQSNSQKTDVSKNVAVHPSEEPAHIVMGESWSNWLKEWGLKLGYLLAFYLFVRYIIYGNNDTPERLLSPLKPWEYIDESGQIRSSQSTSASISKKYSSFFSNDGDQVIGSQ